MKDELQIKVEDRERLLEEIHHIACRRIEKGKIGHYHLLSYIFHTMEEMFEALLGKKHDR